MNELRSAINCRVCLRYDLKEFSKCLSLFETYNGSSISEKVISIANVEIKEGDGLPDMICPDCLLQLENAISFKQKCEASNKVLRCNVLLSKTSLKSQRSNKTCKTPVKEEEKRIELSPSLKEEYLEYSDSEERLEDFPEEQDVEQTSVQLLVETSDQLTEVTSEHLIEVASEQHEEETSEQLEERSGPVKKSRAIDLKLICDDCQETFKSKCKLRVHWKKVHLPEKLVCPNCKRIFKSYKSFHIHMKSNNRNCIAARKVRIEGQGKSRIFHCKECNYKTQRIKDIDTHLAIHTGDRRFQCKDCLKSFTQHASLQCHRESTHQDYRIDTTCHLCGKHLQGRTRYYRHMRSHRQEKVHCKVCNKQFKNTKYLSIHMVRHSGKKTFSCEICAASFYTYSEVYNHRTKVHFKSRNVKCDLCDYKLRTKVALRKHISKHTDTNVICLVCGQFSENAEKLAIHQKRHFDRNVECLQCEKVFHNKRSLYKHMAKQHRCTMLVEKREESKLNGTSIKEESPP